MSAGPPSENLPKNFEDREGRERPESHSSEQGRTRSSEAAMPHGLVMKPSEAPSAVAAASDHLHQDNHRYSSTASEAGEEAAT